MSLDLIAFLLMALFVALGVWRGALATGAGVVSLVVAYGVAVLAAGQLGPPAAQRLGAPEILATPLVGTVAFFLAYGLCGLVTTWLGRWDRVMRAGVPRGPIDRGVGAVFGAVRGALFVVLLSWLALWVDAGRDVIEGDWLDSAPETRESHVAAATGVLVEAAVAGALGDESPGARVAARMAANPKAAIEGLQGLLEDDRVRAIQGDERFWQLVESGAARRAVDRGSFRALAADDAVRARLGQLGAIRDEAVESADVFRADAGRALERIGPRLRQLAQDPELQALSSDPQVVGMLESGDTLGLIGHEGVRKLATRLGAGL